jgi:uncharacterized protein
MDLIIENLRNPALLFYLLGLLAVRVKSDLAVPVNSSKFISLYLLFAIGFKGGQELAHSEPGAHVPMAIVLGMSWAALVPLVAFHLLRQRMSIENSGAVAAAYGSVSAVTFITAVSFLGLRHMEFGGHMVAVMAMMEAPAIIVGMLLIRLYSENSESSRSLSEVVRHALTNGSVFLILGSVVIGMIASDEQAQGIKPFTTDIFSGFLSIFLLDMGIESGKNLKGMMHGGRLPLVFAVVMPAVSGVFMAMVSGLFIDAAGDRFLLAVLAASASYIAVPAAMRMAAPKADPGLYVPMALGITFPFNITLGMPLYMWVVQMF